VQADVDVIRILGVDVARLTRDEALPQIEHAHDSDGPALIAYANAHSLNCAYIDSTYMKVLQEAYLLLGDGSGLALAARMRGSTFPANLNGSDFNPEILALAARRGWKVFFLGGHPGVAAKAAEALVARMPGLEVVGTRHGFDPPEGAQEVVAEIRASGASLIMVAMGNPRQEFWLRDYLDSSGCSVGIGVGAFFDFAAGVVPRSPVWMRRAGLEWLYRLWIEPRRMWRRYVLGNPLFLIRAAKNTFSSR
jgi:exopolysaccharide biosynthesis WecB/TagA/CpsF family protein